MIRVRFDAGAPRARVPERASARATLARPGMSRSERTTTERRAPDPAQVVLYAVALLALADCDGDAWSLDARVFGRRPKPAPGPGAPRGSAARRLLQLAVASQFFFSGLAKVRGIAPGPLLGWFDGSLLYGALFKQAGYASAPLHGFLLRRPGLAPPLAAAALALELAGPVALACYPRSSSSWPVSYTHLTLPTKA